MTNQDGIDNELYNSLAELWTEEFQNREFAHCRFLITAPYMMYKIETFKSFFKDLLNAQVIVAPVQERLSAKALEQYHGQYDIALVGDDQFTEQIIKDSGVKAICKWGTGIDSIDSNACKKHGVILTNTPGAFTIPVAQSILAAILGFCRQTYASDQLMKNTCRWVKLPAATVGELKIGIIGFGHIGQELARLINAFGSNNIGIYDILTFNTDLTQNVEVYETLDDLLAESDIICCCCTYNPSSHYIINNQTIAKIKEGAYLINMARGKLVQETALIEGLCSGRLAGAALDVFEDEPLKADSPLRNMGNVLLSSHNSNSSQIYWNKVHINTIRNALKSATSKM